MWESDPKTSRRLISGSSWNKQIQSSNEVTKPGHDARSRMPESSYLTFRHPVHRDVLPFRPCTQCQSLRHRSLTGRAVRKCTRRSSAQRAAENCSKNLNTPWQWWVLEQPLKAESSWEQSTCLAPTTCPLAGSKRSIKTSRSRSFGSGLGSRLSLGHLSSSGDSTPTHCCQMRLKRIFHCTAWR